MKKLISVLLFAALMLTGCSSENKTIKSFTVVTEPVYTSAKEFSEGFALVSKENEKGETKYFFINTEGEVISKEYDRAASFSDGMAMVATRERKNGLSVYTYGYINTKGEEVIPLQFTSDKLWATAYSFCNGYALLENFPLPGGEPDKTYSYLIDKNGNKAGDFVEYYGKYGDAFPEIEYNIYDTRILHFEKLEYTLPQTDYYGKSHLRYAVYTGNFPVQIYDPIKKQTLTIDKNLKIIDSSDGYVKQEFENGYKYIDYDYGNYNNYSRCALVDDKGNAVVDKFNFLTDCGDGIILISDGNYHQLYDIYGQPISEKQHLILQWENGFIFKTGRPHSIIVDRNLKELWRSEDLIVSENGYKHDMDTKESTMYYYPLLVKSHDFPDGKYHSYFNSYYNPYTGKEVIPCVKGVEWQPLTEDYYFATTEENYRIVNPKPLKIYNIEKDMYFELEGIEYIYEAADTYGSNMVTYQKTGSSDWYAALLTSDENGAPVFTEEKNVTTGKDKGKYVEGIKTIAEEENCSVYEENYTIGSYNPVKLKYKGNVLGEYRGVSFVHRGVYMVAENVENVIILREKSIMNTRGEKLTEVYDDFGILREDFIKYKKDGKWGYLKAE